jgi:hypothetical protein
MNQYVIGTYVMTGFYAFSAVLYYVTKDYSLATLVGLMSFTCFHAGQKLRKKTAPVFVALSRAFSVLGVLFLMIAVDYGMDGKWVPTGFNLMAASASAWFIYQVRKR